MSLNKFQHPRNPFLNNRPDFALLAKLYPEFKTHCKFSNDGRTCWIDFKSPAAVKSLCCTILKHFYGLDVDMPLDHLIPRGTISFKFQYC
jgi:methyltransferase